MRIDGGRLGRAERPSPLRQISFFPIWSAMYSACRMASVTIVSVGFSAAPVVNWLPSETNRFFTSRVWPHLLTTPSRGVSAHAVGAEIVVDG